MSAFVVNPEHIDAIVIAINHCKFGRVRMPSGQIFDGSSIEGLTEAGRKLIAANVASVIYRYEDDSAENYMSPRTIISSR